MTAYRVVTNRRPNDYTRIERTRDTRGTLRLTALLVWFMLGLGFLLWELG